MYNLSTLHAIYQNSPIGFLLVELLYEDDLPTDFMIHYSNSRAAAILGFSAETVIGKCCCEIQHKGQTGWLRYLHDCIESGQKKEIYDFTPTLNQYLKIDCFPCNGTVCGCFLDIVPGYPFEKAVALKPFENETVTANDAELLQLIGRSLTYNAQFDCPADEEYTRAHVCEEPACYALLAKESTISAMDAMDMLQRCAELLSENMSTEHTFRCILERMCKFFHADSGFIALYTRVNTITSWAEDVRYQPVAFPGIESTACLEELTAMLRKRVYISIPDTSAADIPARYRKEWGEKNARSLCFLPIFLEEALIGFVSLANISANLSQIHIVNILFKVMGNIIQNARLREENVHLQYADTLTGYLNFESFKKVASKILRDNPHKNYALCNCDIKRFKYVNDMFGYGVGDALLKCWADTVNAVLREKETFCRVSADNFIILKWYENESEMERCFHTMLAKLNEFPEFRNKHFRIDFITGVYLLNEHDITQPDINKLMDKAGIARNSIKGTGSRLAFYDNAMRERQLWELQVCQTIHDSLKERRFCVCFQPQYDYVCGDIIGAEALVRWKHPVLGWISPKDFIPVLEKNGLVGELDMFVWEEACKLLQQMTRNNRSDTAPIPISVNVSRLDIYMNELRDILLGLMKKYELQPSMLHLEITEGAYIEDSTHLIAVIEDLHDCGFNVHMDDFGSGYSSLNILKDVPVNVLKLDMKFLSAENAERGGNILSSIMGMAQHIGLAVIAEGVETKAQADYLSSLGCRYMQGYYFARPMTVECFTEFLKNKEIL